MMSKREMKRTAKLLLSVTIIFLVVSKVSAQQETGVHFEPLSESWGDILNKAKTEHKDIFVDCYATWCGPCKIMDRDVYPNDTIGRYMNNHFMSVKVQMDKTKTDNDYVKKMYGTAESLEKELSVNAYPTML